MVLEDGVDWKPLAPESRGRHASFRSAVEVAAKAFALAENPFFDEAVQRWKELFPSLPAQPGRYEHNTLYLYVRNAPTLFMLHARRAEFKAKLKTLATAPTHLDVRVEIHTS